MSIYFNIFTVVLYLTYYYDNSNHTLPKTHWRLVCGQVFGAAEALIVPVYLFYIRYLLFLNLNRWLTCFTSTLTKNINFNQTTFIIYRYFTVVLQHFNKNSYCRSSIVYSGCQDRFLLLEKRTERFVRNLKIRIVLTGFGSALKTSNLQEHRSRSRSTAACVGRQPKTPTTAVFPRKNTNFHTKNTV